MEHPTFSIVIPVFNRPEELEELLLSLCEQTEKDFEVVVVEDGSMHRSDHVVEAFKDRLSIQYIEKANSGPGPSRNEGFRHARGDFFVVFDSDCIIPPNYLASVTDAVSSRRLDAWGGPDRADPNFTAFQRATGYTMASILTTGGIRGSKKHVGAFQPRSFNMGISREVFRQTGGFRFERYAEDIEFSIRMRNLGFNIGLITEAFVYHKRRTNSMAFFRQVFNFGKGRVQVGRVYPNEVKLVHWFPAFFTIAVVVTILLPLVSLPLFRIAATFFVIYFASLFAHALAVTRSIGVAALAIPSALLQFIGYGLGFLTEKLRKLTGR